MNKKKNRKHVDTPIREDDVTKHTPSGALERDQTLADFNTTKESEMMPAQMG